MAVMEWAVINADRVGPEGVLLIVGDRSEAETIAAEIRRKGHHVKVLPYAAGGAARRTVDRPRGRRPEFSRVIF